LNIPEAIKVNEFLCSFYRQQQKLFMHLGRHTFATTVTLSNGVPIETVGKMLGHSTLKHTQIYAKVVASKVKSDMQRAKEMMAEA